MARKFTSKCRKYRPKKRKAKLGKCKRSAKKLKRRATKPKRKTKRRAPRFKKSLKRSKCGKTPNAYKLFLAHYKKDLKRCGITNLSSRKINCMARKKWKNLTPPERFRFTMKARKKLKRQNPSYPVKKRLLEKKKPLPLFVPCPKRRILRKEKWAEKTRQV